MRNWTGAFGGSCCELEKFVPVALMLVSCSAAVPNDQLFLTGVDDSIARTVSIVDAGLTCPEFLLVCDEELGGLRTGLENSGWAFEVRYAPKELEACRRANGPSMVREAVAALGDQISAADLYILNIRPGSEEGPRADLQVLLGSGLEKRVHAVVGADSLTCSFAHVESGPGHSPSTAVLFGFDQQQSSADRRVVITAPSGSEWTDIVLAFPVGVFDRYVDLLNE